MNESVINNPNRKQNKKNYYENNKEKVKQKVKKYNTLNKEKNKEKKKIYQEKYKSRRNERHNERYRDDIIYKLTYNFRTYVNKAFKRNGYKKSSKTFDLLGCSFEELKIHLENQFIKGMNWQNHGEWHIDHKIPLSWAKTEEELKELCKYSNLQPLWAEENLSKKNYYANL